MFDSLPRVLWTHECAVNFWYKNMWRFMGTLKQLCHPFERETQEQEGRDRKMGVEIEYSQLWSVDASKHQQNTNHRTTNHVAYMCELQIICNNLAIAVTVCVGQPCGYALYISCKCVFLCAPKTYPFNRISPIENEIIHLMWNVECEFMSAMSVYHECCQILAAGKCENP